MKRWLKYGIIAVLIQILFFLVNIELGLLAYLGVIPYIDIGLPILFILVFWPIGAAFESGFLSYGGNYNMIFVLMIAPVVYFIIGSIIGLGISLLKKEARNEE